MSRKKKIVWWKKIIINSYEWIKKQNKERAARVKKAIAKANKEAKEKKPEKEVKSFQPRPAMVLLAGFLLGFMVLGSIILLAFVLAFYAM
jgi:F0F1-type ATP synthase assembly protein I